MIYIIKENIAHNLKENSFYKRPAVDSYQFMGIKFCGFVKFTIFEQTLNLWPINFTILNILLSYVQL